MIIYMQQTIEMMLVETVEELIKSGEVFKTGSGLVYLKIVL